MTNTLAQPRTAKFDNAKAFLILCVVFGHGLSQSLSYPAVKWAHLWLYSFHMPAFIFLGGLFAKRTVNTSPFNFKKVFSYFLLGMFIKTTIYLTGYFCGRNPKFNLFSENGVAWYIFVMAAHLMIAHALRSFNHKKVLCSSIILALLVGYIDQIGNTMVLSRIIVFFPIFYLGYITDKDKLLNVLNKPAVRIISLAFLLAFTVGLYFIITKVYSLRYILTGNNPYYEFGADWEPFGALLRLGCYIISAVVSFCVLAVMPNKKVPLMTHIGGNTLQIYALHRQLQLIIDALFLNSMLSTAQPKYILVAVMLVSIVLTLALSHKAVSYVLYPCTNPERFFSPLIRWFRK